jgi:hypothetical protein
MNILVITPASNPALLKQTGGTAPIAAPPVVVITEMDEFDGCRAVMGNQL